MYAEIAAGAVVLAMLRKRKTIAVNPKTAKIDGVYFQKKTVPLPISKNENGRYWYDETTADKAALAAGISESELKDIRKLPRYEQFERLHGPPTAAIVNGSPVKTWAEVNAIHRKVESWRKKVDELSTSSSFESLGEGSGHNKPIWVRDSLAGFYHWMFIAKGPDGGLKHIQNVERAVKKTGGNMSFWGAGGAVGSLLETLGNELGEVIGADNAGSKLKDAYGATTLGIRTGDWSAAGDIVSKEVKAVTKQIAVSTTIGGNPEEIIRANLVKVP